MAAFEANIDAKLNNSAGRAALIFREGQPVDYLKVVNQAHRIGTWDYNLDSKQVAWSPEVFEIHGIPPEAGPLPLKRAIQFYQADDARRLAEMIDRAVEMRCGFRCKLRLKRADGSFRLTESNAAPVLDDAGRVRRLVGTFVDITQQTEFENIRQGQQELLVRTIRSMPVAAALLDKRLRFIAWSGRWTTDLNLPDGTELLGRLYQEASPDIAKFFARHLDVAMRGMPMGKDNEQLPRTNGVTNTVDWRIQPWRDKTGDIGGVLLLIHVKGAVALSARGVAKKEASVLQLV